MNYLIVVAHPDDEVLGCGATMYKLSQNPKNQIFVAILCGKADARAFRPSDEELEGDAQASMKMLGVKKVIEGDFPNIKFNTVPHLELTQFIEGSIRETSPDVVITHHPADTNNDHMHTSLSCQAAIWYFQRQPNIKPPKDFLFMECLSSTEWSLNTSLNSFVPNTFVEVGKEAVDKKIEALSTYRGVMRDYPHPRSTEGITGLATYRGAQSGTEYAEAFQSVMRRVTL